MVSQSYRPSKLLVFLCGFTLVSAWNIPTFSRLLNLCCLNTSIAPRPLLPLGWTLWHHREVIYKQLELRPCIGIKSWVFSAFPPLATWWWLTAVEYKPLQFMRPGEWSICYRIAILSCKKTLGVEKGSHGPTPPICSLREGFMEYIYIYIRKRRWHFPVFFGDDWLNFFKQNISQDVSSKMGCVRIQACGRNSTVADVDLSLELEQLAVSGQRGVHLWQILSQAPVVDWLIGWLFLLKEIRMLKQLLKLFELWWLR